jgi:hypothetical protein
MRKVLLVIIIILLSLVMTSAKLVETNIYNIYRTNEFDRVYQIRMTTDYYIGVENEWSTIDYTPINYDTKCLIPYDQWLSNNLVEEFGKKLIWNRVYSFDHNNCSYSNIDAQFDKINIMISDNRMAAYPQYTAFIEKNNYTSPKGVPVWVSLDEDYQVINDDYYHIKKFKYSFILNDHYVFMETISINSEWDINELLETVDNIYNQVVNS